MKSKKTPVPPFCTNLPTLQASTMIAMPLEVRLQRILDKGCHDLANPVSVKLRIAGDHQERLLAGPQDKWLWGTQLFGKGFGTWYCD